jgi:hypothetical protein
MDASDALLSDDSSPETVAPLPASDGEEAPSGGEGNTSEDPNTATHGVWVDARRWGGLVRSPRDYGTPSCS